MKYTTNYTNIPTREAKDEAAIKDIKNYLPVHVWEVLLVECGKAEQDGSAEAFQSLNLALSFAGIAGYPVHALGRKFCKTAYRAWMHSGSDPVQTDEAGYPLEVSRG
jgi:hypothetical protein